MFEGPTKNKHLRLLTSNVGFFRVVKAQNNALGCNCSLLDVVQLVNTMLRNSTWKSEGEDVVLRTALVWRCT